MLETLAALPPQGGYLSTGKVITMLVLVLPWLYLAPRVHKDVRFVRAPKLVWQVAVLAGGGLGVLLWLVLPSFLVGLAAFVVLSAGALIAYGVYRDGRVEDRYKVLSLSGLLGALHTVQGPKVEIVEKVKLYDSHGRAVHPPADPDGDPQTALAYNVVQDMLFDVVYRRASLADFSPQGQEMRVRYVIDGVVVDRPAMSLPDGQTAAEFLKPHAGMDPQEKRRPQEGRISIDIGGERMDMYFKTAGTTGGQMMQFRVVQQVAQTDLDSLGMSAKVLAAVRKACGQPTGIVLVSGRSGSGVTSTLYSLLRDQDAYIKQLVTLEAKLTVELENVTQNTYGSEDELHAALAAALRRDPDVIMVDHCPDQGTAEMILEAAREKMLLVGLGAGDTFTALAKWIKLCGDPARAVEPLRAVLCQLLIRKLCEACRERYRPDPQFLAKANLKVASDAFFHRPPKQQPRDEKGNLIICPACQNTRYVGRTGVFEMLAVTGDLRDMVAANASLQDIKGACRRNRMRYMQEEALQKVVEGTTGIDEVIRTTQKKK